VRPLPGLLEDPLGGGLDAVCAVTEVDLTNKDRLCAKAIATFMLRRDLDKP